MSEFGGTTMPAEGADGSADAASGRLRTTRYERWNGQLRSGQFAWWPIVTTGCRQAMQAKRNGMLLTLSFGLPITACIIFFVLSLLEEITGTPRAQGVYDFVKTVLQVDLSGLAKIREYRGVLWKTVFIFMIKIEFFYLLVLVARVGPGLVADDLRTKALPIYFARPITPASYMFGKWCVLAIFIGAGVLAPNLLALLGGVVLTGGLETIGETLALAGQLTLAGLLTMIVGGLLMLLLSSLTADKRYVIVGWLAVLLLPTAAQGLIDTQLAAPESAGFLGTLSLRNDLLMVIESIFNLRAEWARTPLPATQFEQALSNPIPVTYPITVLALVTLISGVICYQRIVRFSRSTSSV